METTRTTLRESFKEYSKIFWVFIFASIIYILGAVYNNIFVNIMSVNNFLTWHIIFEFSSILVSFSIFSVTYFIYEESKNLKLIILGSAFLAMAFLDGFHTLSFKGMADFFVANDTPNRATVLWVLSRSIGSLGFLLATLTPSTLICHVRKEVFILISTIVSFLLFFTVTYYPNFFPLMYAEETGLTPLKIFIEYIIIGILIVTFIMVIAQYKKTKSNREYMFSIALLLLVFSEFAFTNYGSVYDAFNYIGHFYKVVAYILFYKSLYVANVSAPYREMKKSKDKLREYSDNLHTIVEERTRELQELNKALLTDLGYAREIQRSLLPVSMPKNNFVTFDAQYFPAETLSGDFYNVIKLDEDNIAVYIGDVSGHGVSAAMLTIFADQNIIPLMEREDFSTRILEPGFVLQTIYEGFNETNFDNGKYIVMLYGIYNIKNKCFTYASAGLNVSPYIIKASGKVIELGIKGFPICKIGDVFTPFYNNSSVFLEAGDKILFYSDGLVDVKDKNGEIYGESRLKSFLEKNYQLDSQELSSLIKDNLINNVPNDKDLVDDITFLIMEIIC